MYGTQRRPVGGATDDGDAVGGEEDSVDEADDDDNEGEQTENAVTRACIASFQVNPGRGARLARPDEQVEPVFFHSPPLSFFDGIVTDYDLGYIIDLTPGEGHLALTCLRRKMPYVGICLTEAHRTALTTHLCASVQREFLTEGSPLYEPSFAELVNAGSATAAPKAKAKAKPKPKAATAKAKASGRRRRPADDDEGGADPEDDNDDEGPDEDDRIGPVEPAPKRAKAAAKQPARRASDDDSVMSDE